MTQSPEAATGAAASPLAELLSRNCRALHRALEPLLDPVRALVPVLERSLPDDKRAGELRHAGQELEQLLQKLAAEEAFVLVFGPLKSGKSTLMNAICASYVSEVTALPAYPCMVHVRHGELPSYRLQRHDGQTETLAEGSQVSERLAADHRMLAGAVRSVEQAGEAFDPARHARSAIRRIDVEVPAGDLAESGAVLVDTPGLYTRMKFGYDEMTREYRDVAACAVFVVKPDNLFLDHVFDEFESLLQRFDRIFLVVNLDSSKQDLQPDGSLAPSLEQADPDAVVDAFEALAMSAPLREARSAGRLEIYPVDLLQAAAARIRGDQDSSSAFDRLLQDLTRYLNSNDHLKAFWDNGTARARGVMAELEGVLAAEWVDELDSQCTDLSHERDQLRQAAESLQRLADVDWQQALRDQGAGVEAALEGPLSELREQALESCRNQVKEWFETEESLEQLIAQRLQPVLVEIREELVRLVGEEFERLLGGSAFEAGMDTERQMDLLYAQIGLEPPLKALLDGLDAERELPAPTLEVDLRALPVRRELLDWLFLRGAMTVRRRLLGDEQRPDLAVAPEVKARRLGDSGQQALVDQAGRALDPLFGQAAGPAVERLLEEVSSGFAAQLAEIVDNRSETVVAALGAREAELERLQELMVSVRHGSDLLEAQQSALQTLLPAGVKQEEMESEETEPAPE